MSLLGGDPTILINVATLGLFAFLSITFISIRFGAIVAVFGFMALIIIISQRPPLFVNSTLLAIMVYLLISQHIIRKTETKLIFFIREYFYNGMKALGGKKNYSGNTFNNIKFATNTFLSNRYDSLEKTTNYKVIKHKTGEHSIELIEFTAFKSDYFNEKIEIEKGYVFPPQKDIFKKINIVMARNTIGEYFVDNKEASDGTNYEKYDKAFTHSELEKSLNIFSKPSEVMYTRKFLNPSFEKELLQKLPTIEKIAGFTLELKDGAILIYKKENKYLNYTQEITQQGRICKKIITLDNKKALKAIPLFAAQLEMLKMEAIEAYSLESDTDLLNILSFIINEHDRMQFDDN